MFNVHSWPIRRDRAIFLSGAAAVTGLAWFYLVHMASNLGAPGLVHSHRPFDWTATFLMWTVMTIAMMLPSALPFVFAFGLEHRNRRALNLPYVPAGVFLAGYFAIWTAFSAVAALVQDALHRGAMLSPMLTATSSVFAGGILVAAGVYQWTPFKDVVLASLPLSAHVPAQRLARGLARRLPHGRRSRPVLSWLLLAVDGASICRGRDEPDVDGGDHGVHSDRKGRPGRAVVRQNRRGSARRRRDMDDRRVQVAARSPGRRGLVRSGSDASSQPSQWPSRRRIKTNCPRW